MVKYKDYRVLGILFIVPQLILTLVFFIWPAFLSLKQSFFYADAFGIHEEFASFANYFDLFQDGTFWEASVVTLLMAASIILLTMGLGLLLALLVNACTRGQNIYKSLFLWPYAVAPAIAAILWRFLCQPNIGWLANVFGAFGLEFNYLVHPKQALIVVILASSWQQLSYNFLFYFAAIKAIPLALIEASILDGAGAWQRFQKITLPLLSPTSFFLLLMNLIYAFFETFGVIDVLTHGGPGSSTTNLMYKAYKVGFINMDLGRSASLSVVLMLFMIVLGLVQFYYLDKRVHYA